ncbi:unnamed protein product [Prunus armeniaca]|uniref:Uncharacterized protein n=1 Tax=Prunus armeniaca TaxID=36596 RepID=A0A6J5W3H9_PRUAR|nr:unnamed protein product [Prunus armeniaca]
MAYQGLGWLLWVLTWDSRWEGGWMWRIPNALSTSFQYASCFSHVVEFLGQVLPTYGSLM